MPADDPAQYDYLVQLYDGQGLDDDGDASTRVVITPTADYFDVDNYAHHRRHWAPLHPRRVPRLSLRHRQQRRRAADHSTVPPPFTFGAAATVCVAEVPTIRIVFQNTFPALAGLTGTLTMRDVNGNVVSTQPLVYAPGTTVDLLYPGTSVNPDGSIDDVPGWILTDDGFWIRDPSDEFLRDGIALTYTVNPTATAFVTYPPESSTCANPDGPFPPARPAGYGAAGVATDEVVVGTVMWSGGAVPGSVADGAMVGSVGGSRSASVQPLRNIIGDQHDDDGDHGGGDDDRELAGVALVQFGLPAFHVLKEGSWGGSASTRRIIAPVFMPVGDD